jgi:hypothetical protein
MPTAKLPPYTPEEIARRGEAIYEEKIRPIIESDNKGRRLVIDIETGNYLFQSIEDPIAASHALLERNPDAVIYGMRVGYPAATKLGGSWRLKND